MRVAVKITTCMWFTHTNTQNWCYNRTKYVRLLIASLQKLVSVDPNETAYAFT